MSEFQENDRVILVYSEGCCFEENLDGKTGILHLLEDDPYYLGFVELDVPYTENRIEFNAVDVQNDFIRKV